MLGVGFAALLYFREKRFAERPGLRRVLAVLRAAAVTLIALFLLEPMMRYLEREIEPPIVVIAADNSQSMVLGRDSAEARTAVPALMEEVRDALSGDYDVATYTFGQNIREGLDFTFDEPVTDVSALFAEVSSRYANRNIGAVILATDGLYNRGANPRYSLGGVPYKVLPVAMGDTAVRRDARIAEVAVNRVAYLGNKFPIETVLEAHKLEGRNLNFTISKGNEVLYQQTVTATGSAYRTTLRAILDADEAGTQRYTLRVSPLEGEVTLANNTRDVFVEVIDGRQKIAIIAAAPHPDIGALRSAISASENYQAEVHLLADFDGSIEGYDLLILHQVPHTHPNSEALRQKVLQSEVPVFAIVGGQTALRMLSRFALGVDLANHRGSYHDVGGSLAAGFSVFKVEEGMSEFFRDAPPLKSPFGEWRKANSADVLLQQRVGSIRTDDPLLLVNRTSSGRKVAALLGEGLWRWRLYDYATAESHERFDGFMGSLVQYLALKSDKRFFRLNHERTFMENEPVIITAEVYNEAYEPVNEGEVSLVFRDSEGLEFPFAFSRTATAYRLDAGALPVGTYTYQATAQRGAETLEESGAITVKPFALEGAQLTANHSLLEGIAAATDGRVFYPDQVEAIKAYLDEESQLQPVSYTTEVFDSALNLRWVFFLILALLSAEWFLRKRSGNY